MTLTFGVRNDSITVLEFYRKFYEDVFFKEIDKHNIKTVLHLGDLVHRRKYINFVTANYVRDLFINPVLERDIDLHIITGNHDCYYRNTNRINGIDQLFRETKVSIYMNEPVELTFDKVKFLLCPWIAEDNNKVSLEKINTTDASIVAGHFDIKGFEMYRGAVSEHGFDASMFSRFNYVWSGHYHHKSSSNNISYLGAPYEMTWGDVGDPHGFHIFDTETLELTFVENPYSIFHKVIYNDSNLTVEDIKKMDFSHLKGGYVKVIVENKSNAFFFDMFIDKIEKSQPSEIQTIEDSVNFISEDEEDILSEAEDTLTMINKVVDSLSEKDMSKDDSKELKGLLRELYLDSYNLV